MVKTILLCDCLGTQTLDPDAISGATGLSCSRIHTELCGAQIDTAAAAINNGDVMIACGQERHRFADLAAELGYDAPPCVDLRDRAGWSDEGAQAGPKMAALAAEAVLPGEAVKSVDVVSEGTCLIIGDEAIAVHAAQALCDVLAVTVLLRDASAPPTDRRFDTVSGTVRAASGALGGFEVTLDGLRQVIAGGRGAFQMTPARDGALSGCDIILDLSGATPLFPAPEKREGYVRADPKSQPAVAQAILTASQLVGTFEKPLYVRLEPSLCAHSRAEKPACSNCLNICPTGAITSAGEHVAIDPMICAGCGACAALCPSGAISYDAPPVETVFRRISTLASTYRKAGGINPRLLVHDAVFGRELIDLCARHGRGLPADVIPFELAALPAFGHAEMLAALASGFAHVDILLAPTTEREALLRETELACAIHDQVRLLDISDPDALPDALYDTRHVTQVEPILPMGTRRQVARLAAKALSDETELTLPAGAPYGAVLVDTQACTLCLSCVSLCPSGALGENPDKPQLLFQEDACLQCGLCANICPETAITLQPRFNLRDDNLSQTVLHEEEPCACIECGALFGVKSTIDRIMEKLAGNHTMFASAEAARMIQMCENCRIQAQFHSTDNPFAAGERPRVRTTEDYFSKRKDH